MPRIVAGSARGRRLQAPPGTSTRPTSDRTREALFSALQSLRGPFHGARFLDLYAGSGAVGLEAASRGALEVVLVESNAKAAKVIQDNIDAVGLPTARVMARKVEALAGAGESFDIVFADPPYDLAAEQLSEVLIGLRAAGWIAEDAVVVVERSSRDEPWQWPTGFEMLRDRSYGQGTLWYGRAAD